MRPRSLPLETQVYQLELGAFLDTCECVNTPRSLACWLMAKHSEWCQYIELPFPDPLSSHFADDLLVSEMMKKNPRIRTGIDTQSVAIASFLDAERACQSTNQRFVEYEKGLISAPENIEQVLSNTTRIISRILGPLTRKDLDFAESRMRFGPGATSSVTGIDVVLSRKIASRVDVTPRLYPYIRSLLGFPWNEAVDEIRLHGYSKVSTVPKNAKTDRVIAIEPHMNVYVQLGIGALIRRKLLRAGLDLSTQRTNQDLASLAHRLGLATIDLSAASDTIARRLVWHLLPVEWASLLDLARTEYSELPDGSLVRLEKFSSMGNGYTFELETLIFWALSLACGSKIAVAYGDDIIIESHHADLLCSTLNFCGFKVNGKKTFMAGVFFESCGTDWLRGVNVRPMYFKGTYHDFPSAVIRIANAIRRYSHRRNNGVGCDSRFLRVWLRVISRDSRARRTGIPYNAGDDGLIRNFDEACPRRARHGFQGYLGRVWRAKPVKSRRTVAIGAYVCALIWGSPERTSRNDEFQRGSMGNAAHTDQVVFDWPDLGPWY